MTTIKQQIGLAVAAALVISPTMAGCAPVASDSEIATEIEEAVTSGVPHVTASHASLAYSGTARTIWIRVYVDSEATEDLSGVIDATLQTVWETSRVDPARVTIDAHLGDKPEKVEVRPRTGLDLRAAAKAIGLAAFAGDDVVALSAIDLTSRYGAWTQPGSDD